MRIKSKKHSKQENQQIKNNKIAGKRAQKSQGTVTKTASANASTQGIKKWLEFHETIYSIQSELSPRSKLT